MTAQLEAVRTMCLAAVTASQAALQAVEAVIETMDAGAGGPAPADEFAGQTFEDTPPPTIRRSRNGQR